MMHLRERDTGDDDQDLQRSSGGRGLPILNIMELSSPIHIPVLADEIIKLLEPRPGGQYLDATVGAGGHSRLLLEASAPGGRVIAFDRDERAITLARRHLLPFGDRVEFHNTDFREAPALLEGRALDGALIDLGVSSMQLDDPEAGFSFRLGGPLDMRMDRRSGRTAADLVNSLSQEELAELLWSYGQERRSRAVAAAIVRARTRSPIERTDELARIVRSVFSQKQLRTARIDPATRTFQALRIAVNDELSGLDVFIEQLSHLLNPGGRLAVISFHSLEDRIVKRTLRRLAGVRPASRYLPEAPAEAPVLRLVNRRAIRPSSEEEKRNPRCRSARLRVAERL